MEHLAFVSWRSPNRAKQSDDKDMFLAQVVSLNKLGWKLSIHQDDFQGEPDVAWRAVGELLRSGRTDGGGL